MNMSTLRARNPAERRATGGSSGVPMDLSSDRLGSRYAVFFYSSELKQSALYAQQSKTEFE